jgi:hypothetical protein
VKDGATAIAALGQDIDTALVDLKGGTTGQILAKASDTDLDYSWVTNDVGDITEVTAGTGLTGGGTSGAVTLSFDQANFGGGQYAAGKNKIINGDFYINQRNFTSVTTNVYFFDRFRNSQDAGAGSITLTPEVFTPGTAPVAGYEGKNFLQIVTTGQSSTTNFASFLQNIEDVRTFAGQTVTFSFWARATSGTPNLSVEFAQYFGTGGSPSASVNTTPAKKAITTSWARYSFTVTLPSISGKTLGTNNNNSLNIRIWCSAGSTLDSRTDTLGNQNNTFQFWGLQAESGSTASPFQTATGTLQGELAACQRYYWRSTQGNAFSTYGLGIAASTTLGAIPFLNPVTMRVNPTSIDYSTLELADYGGNTYAVTNLTLALPGFQQSMLDATTAGVMVSLRSYILRNANNAAGYVGVSAEL